MLKTKFSLLAHKHTQPFIKSQKQFEWNQLIVFQQKASTLTSAPMTPRLVSLKYSNGLVLLPVLRNGYRYKGI